MTDYKILQNIDLAQNEIKEVSKIANDRQDGKDKGLLIQTGDNTSLTFNRKIGGKENFIKGAVIDGASEEKKESVFTLEPSKVSISNTKGTTTLTKSEIVLGLNSEKKEHIEAISPLVDIKTGITDYTDPHISLKKEGSTLRIQSNTVEIKSKGTTESSLTMAGSITGVSNDILLKDSNKNVSLNLKADGTITESASKSIKETVDKVSIALVKDTTQSITLKNEKETTPSQIEILEPNVKVSKGSNSYVNLTSSGIEEKSNNITVKTPNNVTLTLDETGNSASLDSKGTITLTSNKGNTGEEASTSYGANEIVSTADTLKLHTQGYKGSESTRSYPHIELISSDTEKSILMEGNTIDISSKGDNNSVSITGSKLDIHNTNNTSITSDNTVIINGTESITEISKSITLKDDLNTISLNLNTDGTIRESANTSITEEVGTHTVSINTSAITIEDSTTSATPSKIVVNNTGIKASKGENSYINIESGKIEEKSNTVTVKTPNVVFSLNESDKSASLKSESGTITLTSQNGAKTSYENNKITTEADTITIKSKGYVETDATKYKPHIELKSSENSALIESKTINIYSKDSGSNPSDTINVSSSTVNITGTTTNIKTDTLNIKKSNGNTEILTLDTKAPKVVIPKGTETDINSQIIGLGDSDSETAVSGSTFTVNVGTTEITSTTATTVSGTTTLRSEDSSSAKNTLEVKGTSTSITGNKVDINPKTIKIGEATTTTIDIGRSDEGTTTLKSKTTNITSPTLEVTSGTVNFSGTNQKVAFTGTGSSLLSQVPTVAKDTTVTVKKGESTDVFKVDTASQFPSTTINGTTATINSSTVNIGTATTTAINVGRSDAGTTTLKSDTTNITSPKINVGTESPFTSVKIGKTDSNVTITGNKDLSITADKTNSKVQAKDIKFTNSLSDNNIKIYWDSALQSLVFARA